MGLFESCQLADWKEDHAVRPSLLSLDCQDGTSRSGRCFDVVMCSNLTSNSEELPGDTAGCKSGNQTASASSLTDSTPKGKDNEKLLKCVNENGC